MANHTKPTKEQLEENLNKSQEQLEKETKPTPEEEEITTEEEEVEPTPSTPNPEETENEEESTEDETEEESETEEEEEKPQKKVETPEETDYKKKFTESSREAQIIAAREKQINQAIDDADALPEPTDDEMKAKYPDWDIMEDSARITAKTAFQADRKFKIISDARRAGRDIEAWNTKVDTFVEDPQTLITYPQLEGQLEEFKQYVAKPTRRGVDFEVLVDAFTGIQAVNKKQKNKGAMFDKGTGGPNTAPKPKSNKISVEESERLRKTNYNEYRRLLKAGRISTSLS